MELFSKSIPSGIARGNEVPGPADQESFGPNLDLDGSKDKLNLFPWDDRLTVVSKLPNVDFSANGSFSQARSFQGESSRFGPSKFDTPNFDFPKFDFPDFGSSILDRQFRKTFRTIDGSNNNNRRKEWGKAHTNLLRLTKADYADKISEPRGGYKSVLPSARAISNAVADQSQSIPNSFNLSDMFWQWGQFIDHDIDITESSFPLESFNIKVPKGDPMFDPRGTGNKKIGLNRSLYDENTGTSSRNPRQQVNEITAFIDGSMVYGSDPIREEALRANDGSGKLKVSSANGETLLPYNTTGLPNAGGNGSNLFLAGDVRANEQIGLTAMHTLFVREHNRVAGDIKQRLQQSDPKVMQLYIRAKGAGLSDGDFIYQAARKVIGAQIQAITYNEFLPLLVGKNEIPKYRGYKPHVDPSISNEFSTAAFRFGHTMLSPQLQRVDSSGNSSVRLRDAFFNPGNIQQEGVDSLIAGLAGQKAQELDNKLIDDVRNFLFGPPGSGGFDLASLNIQRGRDHGIPSYKKVRRAIGEGNVRRVSQITREQELQDDLTGAYKSLNDIDLWVGGLAEDPARGAVVGRTFQNIIADQFTRLRDGDRFWYENDRYIENLAPDVGSRSLSDIIKDNTSITNIQDDVFLAATTPNPFG